MKLESDTLILPAEQQPIRAFHKLHGKTSDEQKAREVLRSLQNRKKIIGPGIERGGCILVTEKRRRLLVDNRHVIHEIIARN